MTGKSNYPLTQQQYVENGGKQCPFCGSDDISGDSIQVNAGQASQEMGCNECDKEWTDVYKLTGYNPVNVAASSEFKEENADEN